MALSAVQIVTKMPFTLMLNGGEELERRFLLFFDGRKRNTTAEAVMVVPIYRFLFSLACDGRVLLRIDVIRGHRGGRVPVLASSFSACSLPFLKETWSVTSARVWHFWRLVSVLVWLKKVVAGWTHSGLAFKSLSCWLWGAFDHILWVHTGLHFHVFFLNLCAMSSQLNFCVSLDLASIFIPN